MDRKVVKSLIDHPFIHSLLLGVYPVLALLAINIAEIEFASGLRAIIAALVGTLLLLGLSFWILGNWTKAALVTSLFLALFFSYGHVYFALEKLRLLGFSPGRHRYLLPLYLVIFAVIAWAILRSERAWPIVTRGINLMAVVLFSIPVLQLVASGLWNDIDFSWNQSTSTSDLELSKGKNPPDIYYIIMDGYPRDDVLQNTFGYDNGPFLDFLVERGFFIAECSQSNYHFTRASLASSLNMSYVGGEPGADIPENAVLDGLIQNSAVQRLVDELGYTTVTFETGYRWLHWSDSDLYLSAFTDFSDRFQLRSGVNDFELLLLKTSAALILFDIQVSRSLDQPQDFYELLALSPRRVQQKRVLFTLDALPQVAASTQSPKFVYAHITSPHPPYIFGSNGERLLNEPENHIAGYRDQIHYLNSRLRGIVEEILESSNVPPVIVIQGDHGAVIKYEEENIDIIEKLAILNAYHLPGSDPDSISNSITPVNTFRLIFDEYFGGDFGLLEDKSYFKGDVVQLSCGPDR